MGFEEEIWEVVVEVVDAMMDVAHLRFTQKYGVRTVR